MKNIRFFILLLCLGTTVLFGQTPVPVPVEISKRIENIEGKYYHLHTVEKGQTLYSISRAYHIATDEIKRTIDKPEIQAGEILLIPMNKQRLKALKKEEKQTTPTIEDTIVSEQNDTLEPLLIKPAKSTLNVALMLPLYLNEVADINIRPRDKKSSVKSFTFISLYEGATLAAQAFDGGDVKINVQLFDVTDDQNTAVRLINSGALNDVDIIIGPLFLRSFKAMSDYAKQQNIFIINPLSDRDDILFNNPYVIKINTSEKNQLQALLNYVAQKDSGQRVLVLSNDSLPNESEHFQQAKQFFDTLEDRFDTICFVDISEEKFQQFQTLLSDTKRNAIVYLSNNEAFATEILANVSKRGHASNVLYCLQKIQQLEFTESLYLNDLQTHYVEPFFINYDDENVKNFERLFFETYQTVPDPYAYTGYDVMSYVLQLLKTGNTNYGNILETTSHQGFHNVIELHRSNPAQGLENRQINILKIEASKLKKVNN